MRTYLQLNWNRSSRLPQKPPHARRGGFTLVELLVVVVIMVSLTFLGVPALISLSQAGNFNSNTVEVSELLEQAYSSALSRNTYVWIGFSQLTGNGGGVAMASVYSPHENPADFPAHVSLLTKPVLLPHLSLTTIASQITDPNRVSTSVCQVTNANLGSFSAPINGTSQPLTFVIQVSPSGQVSASPANKYAWMEIGLTPLNGSGRNVAVLQMNAFTGRVSAYRP